MFRKMISLMVLVWLFGFAWFGIALPAAAGSEKTDAAVVFTGGVGRIDRGLAAVRKKWSPKLLVSGVDREVKPSEFEAEYQASVGLLDCCVTLGFESYDTRSNALESSRWIARNNYRSIRLITSDWHMRRAALELEKARPEGVTILRDAVPTEPSLKILFLEYHKLIARQLSWLWDA